jgi:hypothetical protein
MTILDICFSFMHSTGTPTWSVQTLNLSIVIYASSKGDHGLTLTIVSLSDPSDNIIRKQPLLMRPQLVEMA